MKKHQEMSEEPVFLAEEIIQVWREWRGNREANGSDKCDAVLYYAENDAYLS